MGNNASALLQGIELYRKSSQSDLCPGLVHPILHGIAVSDIEFAIGFESDPRKVGLNADQAIRTPPNNFPSIVDCIHTSTAAIVSGISEAVDGTLMGVERVVSALTASRSNVLLLSLPTGMEAVAQGYARAALHAGVALVNCSADPVARVPELLALYEEAGIPLVGDDLASQFGSSLIHKALLDLLMRRGLSLEGTYQINVGGNEDFRNLRANGANKLESKLNVFRGTDVSDKLTVIPSGGYIGFLNDHKVAHMRIQGQGWAGTPVTIDIRLEVQDSSNAAGVIIDLVRIAAYRHAQGLGGEASEARALLKSVPGRVDPTGENLDVRKS